MRTLSSGILPSPSTSTATTSASLELPSSSSPSSPSSSRALVDSLFLSFVLAWLGSAQPFVDSCDFSSRDEKVFLNLELLSLKGSFAAPCELDGANVTSARRRESPNFGGRKSISFHKAPGGMTSMRDVHVAMHGTTAR
eukprot:scaffold5440_cov32-Tisochrysis_lutea.AAC.10